MLDHTPPSQSKWMSPSERHRMAKKIIQGGKIADEIHKRERERHQNEEIPQAEKVFAEALAQAYKKEEPTQELITPKPQKTLWQRIQDFLSRFFHS
jgi:hypothetical protein